jgi:isopentenyl-diphosphate delta-isomerase
MEEQLILVDLCDREIGQAEKLYTHERSLLHRAFSVFIHDGEGRMLIQKRNADKYHSGGLWANACCSHPRIGEKTQEAVHRRLIEEMGFDCPVEEPFSFVYRTVFENGLTEYEYDHVFLGSYSGLVKPNPAEASEVRWVPYGQLEDELLHRPQDFCSWFLIAAPRVLQILRQQA